VTIRKGESWGEPMRDGADPPTTIAATDQAIAVASARGETVVGVTGGDLYRTVGASGALRTIAPIDLGTVSFGGFSDTFAAHVVARSRSWRGPTVVVMNAQFIGSWDMAPRSHPNDGKLDVLEADLSVADTWKAWRRLRLGTHVPHPNIRHRQVRALSLQFEQSRELYVDGTRRGRVTQLDVICEPDALQIVF
jgi:YegS C-terminal NAD kinase beta sandwich-like domain